MMYCLPFDHVGHRRAALRRRHPDRADFLAGRSCRRRAASRRADDPASSSPADRRATTSVLVTTRPTLPRLSGLRDRHPLQRRMVAHRVRRVAVRHLPHQLALVEIDRRQHAVRRLHERQTLRPGRRHRLRPAERGAARRAAARRCSRRRAARTTAALGRAAPLRARRAAARPPRCRTRVLRDRGTGVPSTPETYRMSVLNSGRRLDERPVVTE